MELEIFWTDFSKKELKNIFDYYKEKASLNVAKTLVIGIIKETTKLKKQSKIGQEEELLQKDSRDNGRQLPADDYWFNVIRNDGRIHKGHFALLR